MSKRDSIIDAALSIMCEEGIDALTLSALFERAHTGSGAFYHHFRDRNDLIEAVYAHCYDVARETLVDKDDPALSTRERFDLFIYNLFQAYAHYPRQLDFIYQYSYDYLAPAENYIRVIPSLLLLTSIISLAQKEGLATQDLSPMVLSRVVRSMVASAYWAHARGELEMTDRVIRHFAKMTWCSICITADEE